MASKDDSEHDESGESGFGPPTSGFGPPVGEFGPPMDAFGPPTGGGAVGWQPADAPERPAVGWQPADGGERPSLGWQPVDQQPAPPVQPTVPAPPQQYRAPDSTGSREIVQPPQQYRAPDSTGSREIVQPPQQYRAPDSTGSREIVQPQQYSTGSQETVRYSDQAGGQGGPDTGTWQAVPPRPPTRPEQSQSGQPRSLWDDDDLAKKLAAPREPSVAARGSASGKSSSSGSLWDDDDMALDFGSSSGRQTSAPTSDGSRRNRGVLYGGIAAGVVVVLAIVGVIVYAMRGGDHPSPNPTATPGAQAPTQDGGASCQTYKSGGTTVGNGPGDTNSGVGAILGFEHAIYTDRSAAKALTFVKPNTVNVAQQVIDQYPVGTTYCLRINELTANSFLVVITENTPDGKTQTYREAFDTQQVDGKYLIARAPQGL
ncbi:hypothetical protein [Nocardia macrotermitis]|uniref:DUF8176 domain-containing protein n=1 Tax=Nocardia macrotermitis TaxID=2585198 RepID=A0A7K0DCL0_9NOCA|nr:hypothetical protein [Nocardia macrotermitis]MQY23349.1 hypothetical protein [Nocardia macrotermitis]